MTRHVEQGQRHNTRLRLFIEQQAEADGSHATRLMLLIEQQLEANAQAFAEADATRLRLFIEQHAESDDESSEDDDSSEDDTEPITQKANHASQQCKCGQCQVPVLPKEQETYDCNVCLETQSNFGVLTCQHGHATCMECLRGMLKHNRNGCASGLCYRCAECRQDMMLPPNHLVAIGFGSTLVAKEMIHLNTNNIE